MLWQQCVYLYFGNHVQIVIQFLPSFLPPSLLPSLPSSLLLPSELSFYDEFARDQILQLPFAVTLPEEGSVFDYYLDLRSYQFLPWSERRLEGRDTAGYIALPEV